MPSKYRLLGLAFGTVLILSNSAYGCSCVGAQLPCQDFGTASAVFVGTVRGIEVAPQTRSRDINELNWTPKTVKFSVEQSFLGVAGTEIEVATGRGGGDCGYGFSTGQRYLVYAYASNRGGHLVTSICTRTKPYAKANEDLQFLGNIRSQAPGVAIYGEVRRQLHSIKEGDAKTLDTLADVALIIEGEGERKEIRTDEQGRYRLSGLPAGKYEVTLVLPDELTVDHPRREVTIADRGCVGLYYFVTDNGRIGGRVFDAEGQPAARVLVTLVEPDAQQLDHYNKIERADQDGRYSFGAVPPGRYLLAVNVTRYPELNDPTSAYPRTYFPGVADASQATVITLGAGEKLSDRDLRLLPRRAERAVDVRVVWADGKPVANAEISVRDVTYYEAGMTNMARADQLGRFTLHAYEGQIFVIEARSARPSTGDPRDFQPKERTAPVRITVGNQPDQVKIVITRHR